MAHRVVILDCSRPFLQGAPRGFIRLKIMGAPLGYNQFMVSELVHEAMASAEITFKGQRRGGYVPWRQVIVRPVVVRGASLIQFSYFESQQNIVKNYRDDEARRKLDELLDQPFKSIVIKRADGVTRVQFSKKGKPIIHRERGKGNQVDRGHDRPKNHTLPADNPDAFLQAVSIMNANGTIRPRMYSKFKQINAFLDIFANVFDRISWPDRTLQVTDLGCGSAYLTFAAYHFLHSKRGLPIFLHGVDVKAELMARHADKLRKLGWEKMAFHQATILDYQPETSPDIVLALHACDTATDEAIARGIEWQSNVILCAPCCHHHLQAQLNKQSAPKPFTPVMRHGVLREEVGTILTDTFRAQLLQMHGYQVDVIEFVSAEHTPKNNLIRAIKVKNNPQEASEAYNALKQFWQVTPYLETLL